MVPPPKNPIQYQIYMQRQRESRLGKIPWNKGKFDNPKDIMKRFNSKYMIKSNGCWGWQGFKHPKTGYASFWVKGKDVLVHRFSYEMFNGPIPETLTVDHLCRNRICVNPYHLDLVTRVENVLRSENKIAHNKEIKSCPHGHQYNIENTHITKEGYRHCKTCSRIRNKKQKIILKNERRLNKLGLA